MEHQGTLTWRMKSDDVAFPPSHKQLRVSMLPYFLYYKRKW
jgi:hypothetical protein